jgi:hypothetical protein
MRKLIFLLCLFLPNIQLWSQTSAATIDQLIVEARSGKSPLAPANLINDSLNAASNIAYLSKFCNDTVKNVRSLVYGTIKSIGRKSRQLVVRQQAVAILVTGCNDPDAGIVNNCTRGLGYFKLSDFTRAASDSLLSCIQPNAAYLDIIIRLAGFVKPVGATEKIRPFVMPGNKAKSKVLWSAHLALARLGDTLETAICVNKVKSYPVSDNLIYSLVPDLIYTRQKAAIDYLVYILNMDEKLCKSSNPDSNQSILCGYRVVEMLAPVIVDFPLKVGPSGDLLTNDYEAALQEARKWFTNKAGNYQVIFDSF